MRRRRNTARDRAACALAALAISLAGPRLAHACGFTPVGEDAEAYRDALGHLLSDPQLPLLDPDWYAHYWVLAWARTRGKHWSPSELAALLDEPDLPRHCSDCRTQRAVERWREARTAVARRVGAPDAPHIEPYRFQQYQYTLLCAPDAFDTAVATLGAREASYSDAELAAWIEAQDRVFARCDHPEAPSPVAALSAASAVAHADRDYQIATAQLYGGQLEDAARRFDALAGATSTWADIARYRAAYVRFVAGGRDAADLRRRLAVTQDDKARRGLVQLLDRVELYPRGAAAVTTELSRRLLDEDLGADVVRVVRDLARFAREDDARCTTELGRVLDLRGGNTCDPALPRTPLLQLIAIAIAPQPEAAPAGWAPLLRLNAAFYDARHAMAQGQIARARTLVRQQRARVSASSRGTINAFRSLELAASPERPDPAVLLRHRAGAPDGLHGDGRMVLRALSSRVWLRLASDRRVPEPIRLEIATQGLVRSVLLERRADTQRFVRAIASNPSADPDFVATLRALPAGGADLEIELLLLLARHDPGEMTIDDELAAHYGSLPESGCALDACDGRTPAATPVGTSVPIAVPPSAERRRIIAGGRRVNLLGRAALRIARQRASDPRVPELLAQFVRRTRRASMHHATDDATGPLSRQAFELLHQAYADTEWARNTRYWYR